MCFGNFIMKILLWKMCYEMYLFLIQHKYLDTTISSMVFDSYFTLSLMEFLLHGCETSTG